MTQQKISDLLYKFRKKIHDQAVWLYEDNPFFDWHLRRFLKLSTRYMVLLSRWRNYDD